MEFPWRLYSKPVPTAEFIGSQPRFLDQYNNKLIPVQGIQCDSFTTTLRTCDSSLLAAFLELLPTLILRRISPHSKLAPPCQASYSHLRIADIPSRGASVTCTPTSTNPYVNKISYPCAEPCFPTTIIVTVLELKRHIPQPPNLISTKPSRRTRFD